MFSYIKESNVYWFLPSSADTEETQLKQQLAEFNLMGVLMGLAVYNGEILDIHFPPCVYKKLATLDSETFKMSKAQQSIDTELDLTIGVCRSLTLYDLRQVMPCLAASLQDLLDYEGDVRNDFMLTFVASYADQFDVVHTVELKPNGHEVELDNENRKEYVDLYIDFLLNKSIYRQFKAFYIGFHCVCASNAMIVILNTSFTSILTRLGFETIR